MLVCVGLLLARLLKVGKSFCETKKKVELTCVTASALCLLIWMALVREAGENQILSLCFIYSYSGACAK